ncbi:MAG: cell division protein FtsQ [Alphaproteobacteria bacterium HGW-Alphaproteobacteria-6]|nr:MAG: cell division protein FtsQ [Alphaproteobacteria bacterium HGW-Alphaproteobacteria-6]
MRSLIALRRHRPGRPSRRDPAPSRLAFRMQRLWLTPGFWRLLRVGLPLCLIVLPVTAYLADDGRRAAIGAAAGDLRRQIQERPEFMVTAVAVEGASAPVGRAVRALVEPALPASSFTLDLAALRATVAAVDAVATADLRIRPGGILQIEITERRPAILLRRAAGLEMLDATGHRVATLLDRAARPDLAVIAGAGARDAVPEALAVLAAAAPLAGRVRGLVRRGERRWDLVLDRGQRILLPAEAPEAAVARVIVLDAAADLFGRTVGDVDMRNGQRPTLRPLPAPSVAADPAGGEAGAPDNLQSLSATVVKVSQP